MYTSRGERISNPERYLAAVPSGVTPTLYTKNGYRIHNPTAYAKAITTSSASRSPKVVGGGEHTAKINGGGGSTGNNYGASGTSASSSHIKYATGAAGTSGVMSKKNGSYNNNDYPLPSSATSRGNSDHFYKIKNYTWHSKEYKENMQKENNASPPAASSMIQKRTTSSSSGDLPVLHYKKPLKKGGVSDGLPSPAILKKLKLDNVVYENEKNIKGSSTSTHLALLPAGGPKGDLYSINNRFDNILNPAVVQHYNSPLRKALKSGAAVSFHLTKNVYNAAPDNYNPSSGSEIADLKKEIADLKKEVKKGNKNKTAGGRKLPKTTKPSASVAVKILSTGGGRVASAASGSSSRARSGAAAKRMKAAAMKKMKAIRPKTSTKKPMQKMRTAATPVGMKKSAQLSAMKMVKNKMMQANIKNVGAKKTKPANLKRKMTATAPPKMKNQPMKMMQAVNSRGGKINKKMVMKRAAGGGHKNGVTVNVKVRG
ncbi:unnamed protein product [Amoebophrya sp. A120]|nr:unnamed protein product [Amoebophrya sp. A120]|eukprot:GSA120T00001008001.1